MLPYFLKALLYGWHHSASADAALYSNKALTIFYRHSKKRGHKKPKKAALAPENYAEGDAIDIPYPKGTRKGEKRLRRKARSPSSGAIFCASFPGCTIKKKRRRKRKNSPAAKVRAADKRLRFIIKYSEFDFKRC